ncbi:hypothetical protein [Roseateles sp. P5_E4]
MDWLEFLKKEWATLTSAPISFIGVAAFAFIAGYGAAGIQHDRHVDVLKERLAAKDERLEDYKQRLSLMPASGRKYEALSSADLQAKVLQFSLRLRDLSHKYAKDVANSRASRASEIEAAEGRGDKAAATLLRRTERDDDRQLARLLLEEYDRTFKADAMLFRDELDARLPVRTRRGREMEYEFPANPIGLGIVIDDLEVRAKSLR